MLLCGCNILQKLQLGCTGQCGCSFVLQNLGEAAQGGSNGLLQLDPCPAAGNGAAGFALHCIL